MALVCAGSEAKGQASTEGFCRASARQRWRVDRATPRRFAPSRTEMPFTDASFSIGTGSEGRPKALALRPSALEARNGALLQSLAFELAQRREDCELEPAAGGAKIQTFLQRHEWNVQRLKILEHRQQMFQVAPDSIESPAHNHLDPRATSIEKQPIKTRPAILRPAHLVGVFRMDGPAPRLAVATELEELVLAGLGAVGGADAGVDSGLHGKIPRRVTVVAMPGSVATPKPTFPAMS